MARGNLSARSKGPRLTEKPRSQAFGPPPLEELFEVQWSSALRLQPARPPYRTIQKPYSVASLGDIPRENTMLPGDWDEVPIQTQAWDEHAEDGEVN